MRMNWELRPTGRWAYLREEGFGPWPCCIEHGRRGFEVLGWISNLWTRVPDSPRFTDLDEAMRYCETLYRMGELK